MRILIFLSVFFFAFPLYAQDYPTSLQEDEQLTGNFLQKRYLKGFERPLVSSGTFSFQKKEGLIWKTLLPFETTLTLNQTGIAQTIDGQEAMNIPVGRFPALKALSDVMAYSMLGQWEKLEEKYRTKLTPYQGGWKIAFAPSGDVPFQALHMTGRTFLEKLVIQKPQGDYDEIVFKDQVVKKAD